jgi:hypothetical protein
MKITSRHYLRPAIGSDREEMWDAVVFIGLVVAAIWLLYGPIGRALDDHIVDGLLKDVGWYLSQTLRRIR